MDWIEELFDRLEFDDELLNNLWDAYYGCRDLIDEMPELREQLKQGIINCNNMNDYYKLLGFLLQHEVDKVSNGGRYSQKDILKHLKKII